MECKLHNSEKCRTLQSSINRNIMECKFTSPVDLPSSNTVLIETLWNVNYEQTITRDWGAWY